MDKNELHGWLFTYNQYTDRWIACTRDDYFKLFSDTEDLLQSKSFETLQEIIMKTNGNSRKVQELLTASADKRNGIKDY